MTTNSVVVDAQVGDSAHRRIDILDLLRPCAALMVVLYHFAFRGQFQMIPFSIPAWSPVAKYGYLGVDLFFIISGFVIAMSAEGRTVRQFAISRIARLYPAFWACCLLSFLVAFVGPEHLRVSIWALIINLTMLPELFGSRMVDDVYWTLFVEVQFYALVGLALWTRHPRALDTLLTIWLCASAATLLYRHPILAKATAATWTGYFVAGVIYYRVWSSGWTATRAVALSAAIAISVAHAWQTAGRLNDHFNAIAGLLSLPPANFASLVAAMVSLCFHGLFVLIASRGLELRSQRWRLAGNLTYPFYLIHSNIGWALIPLCSALPAVAAAGVAVATSLGAAAAVHFWIERRGSAALKRWLTGSPPASKRLAARTFNLDSSRSSNAVAERAAESRSPTRKVS